MLRLLGSPLFLTFWKFNMINLFMKQKFDKHAQSWAFRVWRPCYILQILRRHLLSNRVTNIELFLLRIKHSTQHHSQNEQCLSLNCLSNSWIRLYSIKKIGINQKSTLICIFNHKWLHIAEWKKMVINKLQKSSILAIVTTS